MYLLLLVVHPDAEDTSKECNSRDPDVARLAAARTVGVLRLEGFEVEASEDESNKCHNDDGDVVFVSHVCEARFVDSVVD